jgi:hypothetical protein
MTSFTKHIDVHHFIDGLEGFRSRLMLLASLSYHASQGDACQRHQFEWDLGQPADDRRHGDLGRLGGPPTLGFLRLVRLPTPRRREIEIVRRYSRLGEPRFNLGDASLGRLKALPEGADQVILPGVAQEVEVGESGHTPLLFDRYASTPIGGPAASAVHSGRSRANVRARGPDAIQPLGRLRS